MINVLKYTQEKPLSRWVLWNGSFCLFVHLGSLIYSGRALAINVLKYIQGKALSRWGFLNGAVCISGVATCTVGGNQ